ncbi:hypothetical protein D3C79_996260 [compost metagenome]
MALQLFDGGNHIADLELSTDPSDDVVNPVYALFPAVFANQGAICAKLIVFGLGIAELGPAEILLCDWSTHS